MRKGVHERTIRDVSGVEWKAEQDLLFAIEGMGQAPQAHVTFTCVSKGEKLSGHTLPFSPASNEELEAALAEAQRLNRMRGET